MAMEEKNATDYPIRRRNTTVAGIAETLEWVMIALVLAFVFRAFVMEAFRIPTGSMAETLRGDHFHLRCIRCGYEYDVGADYYAALKPMCSSCGYVLPDGTPKAMINGDRILVLKCIYQFVDPKRWDVVVFKNPTNPAESYIKRMIALPGETVEIVDGDIYIDGEIARKPANIQDELWMPIYNNDYQPSDQMLNKSGKLANISGDDQVWEMPFKNDAVSNWDISKGSGTVFTLDSKPDQVNIIYYDPDSGNDFTAKYAYNSSSSYYMRPTCSDLKLEFRFNSASSEGLVGATLKKYDTIYHAHIDFTGQMVLEKVVDGVSVELARKTIELIPKVYANFSFANVDHRLLLNYGDNELVYDLGTGPDGAGQRNTKADPEVRIFGAGSLSLAGLALYRDTYYINTGNLRAAEGDPFMLEEDQFFVCGDNSPSSLDARLWGQAGTGNNGKEYRMGTVPRDYLVGKAFYRYWADAHKLFGNLPLIPSISKMGSIEGGGN
ncbi:MAG: signal peptidase I [Planctomycetes bacterium]|nr:signal peptidase I [Planctomycetota bacterium]